ncbi:MAG: hypothetical protein AAF360_19245 [Pseudomonadota bacterium]
MPALPTEDFSLNYEEIKISYAKSDDADRFVFTPAESETNFAVLLKAEKPGDAASRGDDAFDFGIEEDAEQGLLLPAVQMATGDEPPRPTSDVADETPIYDDFMF